jgi:glycosyltransferase involved in cell wall biosynthesis
MSRVLIVTDRFTPEVSAPSTRLHAHAARWVAAGWDVDVLTCVPNFPRGRVFESYKNKAYQVEHMDGFDVHRVWSYMAPNTGKLKRVLDYASFNHSAERQLSKLPRPDVVLASSPPINIALLGRSIARRLKVPWVFEVRDLWPASIRAVGVSASPLLKLIEQMELKLYHDANQVMVLTDAFREDLLSRGVPDAKLSVVTNAVDAVKFAYPEGRSHARAALSLPGDKFIVGFVGTLGLAQGAGVFVEAAARLNHRDDIHFLVVGEGADGGHVKALAGKLGVKNIEFRNFVAHPKVPQLLAALNIGTVLLKDDPVFETVIPSKIFEILAAGRPIAAAVAGQAQRIIASLGGGVCVAPQDAEGLATAIAEMADQPDRTDATGRAAQVEVAARFDRDKLASNALEVLERLVK